MDPKYRVGIPEIDAQHEEIDKLIASLQQVIAKPDQRYLVHATLKRLNHLLTTHFGYEESLMQMVNYAELAHHKKMHKGILTLFDNYFNQPPAPGDYENLAKLVSAKVLAHVVEHDVQMTGMVRDYLATFAAGPTEIAAG